MQISMAYRPPGIGADTIQADLSGLFNGGGLIRGERHRLQQLHQRGLFYTSFFGAPPHTDIADERVEIASTLHATRPDCCFHWKLVAIAMQAHQFYSVIFLRSQRGAQEMSHTLRMSRAAGGSKYDIGPAT